MHFQSNTREVDLAWTRDMYFHSLYSLNDYLFHIGNFDLVLVSAIPETTLNSTTMLKAFDIYIWIFICISLIIVIVTMVVIEKISTMWIGITGRVSLHQCMLRNYFYER